MRGSPLPIAIVGAGPGGLCMAIRLQQAGFRDLAILEQAEGLGGTWYHNRYPGCECDIPSHLYSFSFAPKPDWSKPYGTQSEILAYLQGLAEAHDLLRLCRFGDGVRRAVWDEREARWTLELESGRHVTARVVVSAIGMFNELAWPDIPGRDDFAGTSFHSARWNGAHDLAGETVGVIGSAASAVQLVPEIVKQARQVYLFQRTANWVMPKLDAPFDAKLLEAFLDPDVVRAAREEIFRQVDANLTFQKAEQTAMLERSVLDALQVVKDPVVREKLTPRHPFGCKRPLLSNDYFHAFNRDNLELVTERIVRITRDAIATQDGRERKVDTIVYATGFETTKYLSAIDVVGRGGLRLGDAWAEHGAAAYLGITTAGFPNLFMLYGPNTNNGSILEMIESQVAYALGRIQRIADQDLAWLDVRPEAMGRFVDEVDTAMADVSAWQAGCNGYYRSPSGRIVTQWPGSMTAYRELTGKPDDDAYDVARR